MLFALQLNFIGDQFHRGILKFDYFKKLEKQNKIRAIKKLFENFFEHLQQKVNLKKQCRKWVGGWMDGWV